MPPVGAIVTPTRQPGSRLASRTKLPSSSAADPPSTVYPLSASRPVIHDATADAVAPGTTSVAEAGPVAPSFAAVAPSKSREVRRNGVPDAPPFRLGLPGPSLPRPGGSARWDLGCRRGGAFGGRPSNLPRRAGLHFRRSFRSPRSRRPARMLQRPDGHPRRHRSGAARSHVSGRVSPRSVAQARHDERGTPGVATNPPGERAGRPAEVPHPPNAGTPRPLGPVRACTCRPHEGPAAATPKPPTFPGCLAPLSVRQELLRVLMPWSRTASYTA